jgi:hypothetical protein
MHVCMYVMYACMLCMHVCHVCRYAYMNVCHVASRHADRVSGLDARYSHVCMYARMHVFHIWMLCSYQACQPDRVSGLYACNSHVCTYARISHMNVWHVVNVNFIQHRKTVTRECIMYACLHNESMDKIHIDNMPSHNNWGSVICFPTISSSKLVLKSVENRFTTLNYYENGSTV